MPFSPPLLARRRLAPAVLGLGLVLGLAAGGPTTALAAGAATLSHGHGGAMSSVLDLRLDNGSKWVTDEALRSGMTAVRTAMAAALPRIHAGSFAPAEYNVLAERVQSQVEHVITNCKLPEAADEQLHLVLAQVQEGAEAMRGGGGGSSGGGDRVAGAVAILQALNAYGGAFDHPGWQPIAH